MNKVYKDNTAKLNSYMHRIARGKKQWESFSAEVEHNISRYENEQENEIPWSEEWGAYEQLVPSGAATIDSLFAALTAVQVDVTVDNTAHGTPEQRRIAERGIDEVWNEQDVAQKSEYVTKDALLASIGWMKVGYEYRTRMVRKPLDPEERDDETDAIYAEAESAGEAPPDPNYVADAVAAMTKEVEQTLADRVTVSYIPVDMLLWDDTARTPDDIRWHCEIEEVPPHEVWDNEDFLEYVKEHGGTEADVKNIKPDTFLSKIQETKSMRKQTADHGDDERITLYRFYDYETGTICTFAKGGKIILLEQPNPFAFQPDLKDRSPFVPLVLRSHPKRVRGISDMTLIEPLLDELNHYRSKMAAYVAQFEPKWMGPDDALTPDGREAISSTNPGDYVGLTSGYRKDDVGPVVPPQLPSEVLEMVGMIINDIREATGVSELMRGIFPDRKRTATETTEVVAASTARQSEKRNAMERFFLGIAKRILILMMMWYDDTRVSRLAEVDADEVWEWTGEDIVMEANLQVHLQPREIRSAQQRKEDAMFLMNVLGPFEEVDKKELAFFVLSEMGFDRGTVRRLLKLDEQMQAEKQQQVAQVAQEALAQEGVMPDGMAGPVGEGVDPTVMAAAEAGGFGDQAVGGALLGP